jgi:hypothetical protein
MWIQFCAGEMKLKIFSEMDFVISNKMEMKPKKKVAEIMPRLASGHHSGAESALPSGSNSGPR